MISSLSPLLLALSVQKSILFKQIGCISKDCGDQEYSSLVLNGFCGMLKDVSNEVGLLAIKHEQKWRALCELSDMLGKHDFAFFTSFIRQATDPEAAIHSVLQHVNPSSVALAQQWRRLVTELWSIQHPGVPILPYWPLSSPEVMATPIYLDVRGFLDAITEKQPLLVQGDNETLLDAEEVPRLLASLPSQTGKPIPRVENEWSVMELRRLRAIVQAARLARVFRNRLVPVKSRIERFRALPPAQQYYVLWHADAYHVDWGNFSGLWSRYMRVMQEYLPVLWETIGLPEAHESEERLLQSVAIIEAYTSLWEEEGVLNIPRGSGAILHVVQQHALPAIIDQFIIRDLLGRHGLIAISEEFGSISKFRWTCVGAKVVEAEASHQLPCGNNLLDRVYYAGHFNHKFP